MKIKFHCLLYSYLTVKDNVNCHNSIELLINFTSNDNNKSQLVNSIKALVAVQFIKD